MTSDPIIVELAGIDPVAKERVRLGRGGKVYTPERTKKFQHDLGYVALAAMRGRKPTTAPVKVECVFSLTLESFNRCDIDNLAKAAMDACNKIIWVDDRLVVELVALKQVGEPGTWLRISEIVPFPAVALKDGPP